jgi:hypothetical protein
MPNYSADFQIDTTPGGAAPTWASMCDGFDNVAPAINETVQEYFSLCAKGYGSSDVVALHLKFTLSGVRKVGDAAQDYIAGLRYKLGQDRKSSLKVELYNHGTLVETIVADCTITDIVDFGGQATDLIPFSCTLRVNGIPTATAA